MRPYNLKFGGRQHLGAFTTVGKITPNADEKICLSKFVVWWYQGLWLSRAQLPKWGHISASDYDPYCLALDGLIAGQIKRTQK